MLQQTRVAAVLDHYAKWMARFPTVDAVAAASEDEVLAAWSGLGYYRRARFLHKGAKVVVAEHFGKLPQNAAELRKLPGIGAYTSAAIASIAFGEVAAVVDGNVERVLLRQTGHAESGANGKENSQSLNAALSAAEIQTLAWALIDTHRPGDFNQAVMELGATICLPRNPLCLQCPVQSTCRTRGEHPTAIRKASVNADVAFALIRRKKKSTVEVMLIQRPATATVMPGMWELPPYRPTANADKPRLALRHAIMQTNYRVSVFESSAAKPPAKSSDCRWVPLPGLSALPLTGLARKILQRLEFLHRP
jgi:A/G-specific adenine glycosylase